MSELLYILAFSGSPSARNALLCPPRTSLTLAQNIRAGLADAQRVVSSSAPDAEKAEAEIEVQVYEGLQAAMNK